ncbi:MAG: hypothetical protein ACK55Z_36710, partial [bacterium]
MLEVGHHLHERGLQLGIAVHLLEARGGFQSGFGAVGVTLAAFLCTTPRTSRTSDTTANESQAISRLASRSTQVPSISSQHTAQRLTLVLHITSRLGALELAFRA